MSADGQSGSHPTPPSLDGVGITPQPEPDAPLAASAVEPPPAPASPDAQFDPVDRDLESLFLRAFSLIAAALLLSAIVASQVTIPDDGVIARQGSLQLLFVFEVVCVAVLARFVPKLPAMLDAFLLFFCAAINGVSFCFFLLFLPVPCVAYGFLMSALAFALTALFASRFAIDLSSWRGMALLFAIGLPLLAFVALGFHLDRGYWAASFTGFTIFASLTWYYGDDICALELEFEDDPSGWKSAICAALILYLNFINLYLIVMRLSGRNTLPNRSDERRRIRF